MENTILENAIGLEDIFNLQNLIIYFIIINIISFGAMWVDKRKAQKGKWRISEGALFILALIGGSIGGIIGMYTFRHKTKKKIFTIGFPVILILQIIIVIIYSV